MKNVIPNFLLTVVLSFIFVGNAPAQMIISTVAGTGVAGYSGDGGSATAARVNNPHGVLKDAAGNLYFTDHFNHRLRRVTPSGIITTVAGIGTAGFSGDGGAATLARLNIPFAPAFDSAGNIYFCDPNNHRLRKIDNSGIITTYAGNGIAASTGDGGQATNASLNYPQDVAVDLSGNVYICELLGHRVRKIARSGVISTIAGTGVLGYSGDGGAATLALLRNPNFVTIDVTGTMYITDNGNHVIRKVSSSGMISTIAGDGVNGFLGDGGPATSARLSFPGGTSEDGLGNLFFADYGNNRIRKVDASGIITTIVGTGASGFGGDGGAASSALLKLPVDVFSDHEGTLYIADKENNRVRSVSNYTCDGAPNSGTASGTITSGCSPYNSILTLRGTTSAVGVTYQWVSSPDNMAYSLISGATNKFFIHAVSSPVYLKCIVACSLSGISDTTNDVHLIYGPPSVPDIVGVSNVCNFGTVTLSNISAGGRWVSSNPSVVSIDSLSGVVQAIAAGTSTVSYSLTNYCGTSFSSILMNVLPPLAPVVNLHLPDSVSTGAFATYQWYKNRVLIPGATSRTYNTTESGDYDVVVTDAMGCKDSSMGLKPLELSFEDKKFETVISPNPATDEIRISSIIPLRRVVIKSVDGRDMKAELNDNVVNISTYPTGMYFISTYSQEGVLLHVSRFTKAK